MSERVRLEPRSGKTLADQLFDLGVEFPCGGTAACGGCRVRLLTGEIPVTPGMRAALAEEELAAGWRLACEARSDGVVELEVEQWSPRVLTDEARLEAEGRSGAGVAIDLGTTTVVAQLVDLATGEVLGVRTALNAQARHGADVMSRIAFESQSPGVQRRLIREQLGAMVASLAGWAVVEEVLIAGNTVMHHLFCGLDVAGLGAAPFRTATPEAQVFTGDDLNWPARRVEFLPCLGGFVGSDTLAGLAAVGLRDGEALIDLGTNGEVCVAGAGRIECASTAAGPAFEAGKISMGMRAGDGAIDHVEVHLGRIKCHVIGGAAARGVCGSGLVDAVAAGLNLGRIGANGRLNGGDLELRHGVKLVQGDIRQLQLAKAAVQSGLALLGARAGEAKRIHLAGAFGNYVRAESARRLGLLGREAEIVAVGNSALRGTRLLLVQPSRRAALLGDLMRRARHVELASEPGFQDAFVGAMGFE